MKNIWHDISPKRISPDVFYAVIEISKGSKIKYELDKETGFIKMDRILHTSTHYPSNYGFIPRTYSDDNDPLDVLILCSESLIPMSLVQCYPIGVMRMMDNGNEDNKIIAVPVEDPNYNMYTNIDQLPKHIFDEMKHFFTVYKELENKTTVVNEFGHVKSAKKIIAKDIENYINIELPVTKKRITLRMQTPRMLDDINLKTKEFKRKASVSGDPAFLFTLQSLIYSVDGNKLDVIKLEDFVRKLPARDSNYIIQCGQRLNTKIGLGTVFTVVCATCGLEYRSSFRYTSEFFGPTNDIDW